MGFDHKQNLYNYFPFGISVYSSNTTFQLISLEDQERSKSYFRQIFCRLDLNFAH